MESSLCTLRGRGEREEEQEGEALLKYIGEERKVRERGGRSPAPKVGVWEKRKGEEPTRKSRGKPCRSKKKKENVERLGLMEQDSPHATCRAPEEAHQQPP